MASFPSVLVVEEEVLESVPMTHLKPNEWYQLCYSPALFGNLPAKDIIECVLCKVENTPWLLIIDWSVAQLRREDMHHRVREQTSQTRKSCQCTVERYPKIVASCMRTGWEIWLFWFLFLETTLRSSYRSAWKADREYPKNGTAKLNVVSDYNRHNHMRIDYNCIVHSYATCQSVKQLAESTFWFRGICHPVFLAAAQVDVSRPPTVSDESTSS